MKIKSLEIRNRNIKTAYQADMEVIENQEINKNNPR